MKLNATHFLEAGLQHMRERAKTYDKDGDFDSGERSMAKTIAMFNAMTGRDLSETEGWLLMCCLKMVRSTQGEFKADNFEDLAAYAGLAGEAASAVGTTIQVSQ